MKKFLRHLALLFVLSGITPAVFAQTSNVTATLTDGDGQTWNNAPWTATLVSPRGGPTISGVPVTPTLLKGTTSSSGVLTGTFTDTSYIDQANAGWVFTIQPNASVGPTVFSAIPITGATPNLSTTLSAGLRLIRFLAGPTSYGYNNTEVQSPAAGAQYYNVSTPALCSYNGTTWSCTGGGSATLPAGLTGVATDGSGNPVQISALPVADVAGAAPLASPALTGTPTAPTAASADNSTKLATTAYADRSSANAVAAALGASLPGTPYTLYDFAAGTGTTVFDKTANGNNCVFGSTAPTWTGTYAGTGLYFGLNAGCSMPNQAGVRSFAYAFYKDPIQPGTTTLPSGINTNPLQTSTSGSSGANVYLYESRGSAVVQGTSVYKPAYYGPGQSACGTYVGGWNTVVVTIGATNGTDPNVVYVNGQPCPSYQVGATSAGGTSTPGVGTPWLGYAPGSTFTSSGLMGTMYLYVNWMSELIASQAQQFDAYARSQMAIRNVPTVVPPRRSGGPTMIAVTDSIGCGYQSSNPCTNNSQVPGSSSWLGLLPALLVGQPAWTINGESIVGVTAAAQLSNFYYSVVPQCASQVDPTPVLIALGSNDFAAAAWSAQQEFDVQSGMAALAKAAGCGPVFIATMPDRSSSSPAYQYNWEFYKNQFNSLVRKQYKAGGFAGVLDGEGADTRIGADGAYAAQSGNNSTCTSSVPFWTDGLHFNNCGQTIIAQGQANAINAYYGSTAANPTIVSNTISSATIGSGGTGYTTAPYINFAGGNCSLYPVATTTVSGGAVATITFTTTGMCSTAPTMSFSGGGGSGATATATLTPITSYTMTASDTYILALPVANLTLTLPSAIGQTGNTYKVNNSQSTYTVVLKNAVSTQPINGTDYSGGSSLSVPSNSTVSVVDVANASAIAGAQWQTP